MKIIGGKFNKTLKEHKQLILKLADLPYDSKFYGGLKGKIDYQILELCLVYADFKCQKCKSEENLTQHHLTERAVRFFIEKERYVSSRYYWNNSIILCRKCHLSLHGLYVGRRKEEELTLSKEKIDKIKKKYL